MNYFINSHGGSQPRKLGKNTDPDPGTCFGGSFGTYVCVLTTFKTASFNPFLSYFANEIVVGLAQGGN